MVVLQMEYWEWYARALRPGEHYVEITREEDHVCEEIIPKVGCGWRGRCRGWGQPACHCGALRAAACGCPGGAGRQQGS